MNMLVPVPAEVASVVIDGFEYATWESVMVQHRWMEAFPIFEIAVSEPTPSPTSFSALRFDIGDLVTVYLAGIQAIYGVISVRQSASDEQSHGVQLIGKGLSWQMAKSSISLGLGNFDGQSIVQIATTICAPYNVPVKVVGNVDMTPFARLQSVPGEPAWDFLERQARFRNTIIGSDEFGALLLIGQNIPAIQPDTLIEGGKNRNIEKINVVKSNDTLFANYFATGQNVGSDQIWGAAAAQIAAQVGGLDPLLSSLVIPVEEAVAAAELQKRLLFEKQIHDATQVRATVTVPGWLRSSGDLWRVGQTYTVIAPDHFPGFPNGIQLAAQVVTFQQNEESGTITTLELVLPWLLNGSLFQQGLPAGPKPSDVTPFPN
jgi:prophage tail gpP-like protein